MEIKESWITGFVDGDGCFHIQKTKATIRHTFIISQDKRSVSTLYAIKKKFKCGSVHKAGKNMMEFVVSDKKSLETIIIPFFKKYPLQTEKRKDFDTFAKSLGFCDVAFPPAALAALAVTDRATVTGRVTEQPQGFSFLINDDWFAGFVDAEGCFYVSIVNNYPRPQLLIGALEKEKNLLFFLQNYLQCGHIRVRKDNFVMFSVTNSKDFVNKIFPKLFTKTGKNLLKTSKRLCFQKFKKIVSLIVKKQHLTMPGQEKILKLKLALNKNKILKSE